MIKVVIVEDIDTIREGLGILINATEGLECSAKYNNCEDMLAKLEEDLPDVILMDIGLPGMTGIEGVKEVKKKLDDVNIIMLSVYEEHERIFNALCAGASGYLVKKTPPAQLIEAIVDAHNGGSPMTSHIARKVVSFFHKNNPSELNSEYNLTKREKEILASLSNGNSYKLIADEHCISLDTVRYHIRNIYKKLQVNSQTEAVSLAIKKRLV